ncbi:MAG: RagB/SusD family nutrient uptake outer membrane protein [Bacteroides sp.]
MKYKLLFFTIGLLPLLALFSSCSKELELSPSGNVLTVDQIKEAGKMDVERADVVFKGMYGELKRLNRLGNPRLHYDFGIASIALMTDHRTDKMWANENIYNWYRSIIKYEGASETSSIMEFVFSTYYGIIAEANKVLNTVAADDDAGKSYHAQARALRAFSYLNLIQLFQFTYKGHEDLPGVPLVKENMTRAQQIDNPRAAVKDVYNYILQDLDYAVEILKDSVPRQRYRIGGIAAYGLRARTHLLMQNYEKAKDDAEQALYIADVVGLKVLSANEAKYPGFNDINEKNIIWGIQFTPDDPVVKTDMASFESMMCSLKYAQSAPLTYSCRGHVLRKINPDLFNQIDPSDCRKTWWVTNDYTHGLKYFFQKNKISDAEIPTQISIIQRDHWKNQEYVNIKFGPYDNNPGSRYNAADFPLMRMEEMRLIAAEARGHINEEDGIKALETFVQNRQSSYSYKTVKKALNQNSFDEEIYRQRAIEFWGEGLTFFDMMRFEFPLVRANEASIAAHSGPAKNANQGGYPTGARFNLAKNDPHFLFQIPRVEILNNPKVVQNEGGEELKDMW